MPGDWTSIALQPYVQPENPDNATTEQLTRIVVPQGVRRMHEIMPQVHAQLGREAERPRPAVIPRGTFAAAQKWKPGTPIPPHVSDYLAKKYNLSNEEAEALGRRVMERSYPGSAEIKSQAIQDTAQNEIERMKQWEMAGRASSMINAGQRADVQPFDMLEHNLLMERNREFARKAAKDALAEAEDVKKKQRGH